MSNNIKIEIKFVLHGRYSILLMIHHLAFSTVNCLVDKFSESFNVSKSKFGLL